MEKGSLGAFRRCTHPPFATQAFELSSMAFLSAIDNTELLNKALLPHYRTSLRLR